MGTKTIILVRHGQYIPAASNQREQLTALGRRQAQYAGKRLSERPRIDRIVHSTMPRANETAQIIRKELRYRGPFISDKILEECVPGYPVKLRKKNGYTDIQKLIRAKKQADLAFKKYFKSSRQDSVEVLVCHGNMIRYLICKTLGIETDRWCLMDIKQCAISIVEIRSKGDRRKVVISHNDIGHIPFSKRTFM